MFSRLIALFRTHEQAVPEPIVRSLSSGSASQPTSPLQSLERRHSFSFESEDRASFYRFLRDHIPIVSSGIWTWVNLCCTPQRMALSGSDSETRTATRILDNLSKRIYPRDDGDSRGFERLVQSIFLDLFTVGRVALIARLLPDRSGISHIQVIDPYLIHWKRDPEGIHRAYLEIEDGSLSPLPQDVFFYRTLLSDLHNPVGIEPLSSIPFVVDIEQRMLNDMARSSHNAGTPRLQIRMTPPEKHPGEDFESYTSRSNEYFSSTMQQFRTLEADDNVFTWSDVEVQLVGGAGREGTVWKINREQVIEDVITGLKLFPWVLGRSHGTTKNWVYAQYNLLMQIADSVQQLGSDLIEWLATLELRLHGNIADPNWKFTPNQDPFLVDRNRARLLELDRVERLVKNEFITRDQGIRELGYKPEADGQRKSNDDDGQKSLE
ncbi:hypothetical protein BMS3Bbin04_01418 [bacterium BMS3Bbin04]|nr:hypothetical protein BMS3Bbin04_01418 [bacterium BMS3Bbin04]